MTTDYRGGETEWKIFPELWVTVIVVSVVFPSFASFGAGLAINCSTAPPSAIERAPGS